MSLHRPVKKSTNLGLKKKLLNWSYNQLSRDNFKNILQNLIESLVTMIQIEIFSNSCETLISTFKANFI